MVMVRCGAVTAVGSDAVAPGFGSLAVVTLALFVAEGAAAPATETTSGKLLLAPFAIGVAASVQVTGAPAMQVQPLPPLPAATKVRPAGKVSFTVMAAKVGAEPLLVTMIV